MGQIYLKQMKSKNGKRVQGRLCSKRSLLIYTTSLDEFKKMANLPPK